VALCACATLPKEFLDGSLFILQQEQADGQVSEVN
jgi:hypothetical protein